MAQGFGQTILVAGDEILVGESLFANQPGYVYVYRKDASGKWVETARLQASDAENNDHFGRTLAIAEGDLLVGSTISRESGALYVFQRTPEGNWRETASMVPSDARPENSFGRVGATDGRIVMMADWAADSSRGHVYVFAKQNGAWRETQKLVASDAQPNGWFGSSLSIAGDRVVIGSSARNQGRGGAYLFTRAAGGNWQEATRIAAPDTTAGLQFGASVALVANTLVVGAPGADRFLGALYVYTPDASGTNWTMASKIAPPAGVTPTGSFGSELEVVGEEIWVGAPGVETGRIYRLARGADGNWAIAGSLSSTKLLPGDGFGGAIDVRGPIAASGVTNDDFGYGSVIVLEQQGENWVETGQLISEVKGLDPVTDGRVDCAAGKAKEFTCGEVDLLSFMPISAIGGGRGVALNDVWGWTDPQTGKEWAIVGRVDGTSFIDVSNPARPVFVGDLPMHAGARANTWRDIKVYKDHAFIVADGAGAHGVQVFDLTRLRNVTSTPVKFTEDAHYDRVASAHNIVINEATGFAYAVGSNSGGETCGGGLHMIDIREPKKPVFGGCFQDMQTGNQRTGYSHDAQCVTYQGPDEKYRGREICLGFNEMAVSIADVTEKGKPIAISRAAYPNVGYTHQGWFDEKHEFVYVDDEGDEVSGTVPRTRTLIWDVRDLDDPVLVKEHLGTSPASDHNLYIVGNLMYQSNYNSGLRILDISNRGEPKEVGFFDTVPWAESAGFDGSWSNYPFFASGTIIVTSIREGVFMLKRATRPVS
jgi:choice-of-anchor B domain-containing protein